MQRDNAELGATEDDVTAFAVFCSIHYACERRRHVDFVLPDIAKLQQEYFKIFQQGANNATIVKILLNGALQEVEDKPGLYVYATSQTIPDYLRVVLEHLHVDVYTKRVVGMDGVECWYM